MIPIRIYKFNIDVHHPIFEAEAHCAVELKFGGDLDNRDKAIVYLYQALIDKLSKDILDCGNTSKISGGLDKITFKDEW